MTEDRSLEDLLRQADRAAGCPPTGPGVLAGRVRRLARRRRIVTIAGSAAAAVVLGLVISTVGLWYGSTPANHEVIAKKADSQEQQDQIASLRAEIEQVSLDFAELALKLIQTHFSVMLRLHQTFPITMNAFA